LDETCPKLTADAVVRALNAKTWQAKVFQDSLVITKFTPAQLEEYENKIVEWLK